MSRADAHRVPTTSLTLLGRLRDPADAQAWREFDRRYRDLIVRFLRSRGLQLADCEDTAQIVLTKLIAGLRSFEYDAAKGGFRAYLFRCSRSGLADFFRRQGGPHSSVSLSGDGTYQHDKVDDDSFAAFEREWVDHHYRVATQRYRESADERAIAILEATLAGTSVRTICEELSMNDAAVHKAQQRLRNRLRALIAEQLADEEEGHERRTG